MKKLVALLIAGAFIVGCSSDKPAANDNLVVVKHNAQCKYTNQAGETVTVPCKRRTATSSNLGS